jgi:hypothetical protein
LGIAKPSPIQGDGAFCRMDSEDQGPRRSRAGVIDPGYNI